MLVSFPKSCSSLSPNSLLPLRNGRLPWVPWRSPHATLLSRVTLHYGYLTICLSLPQICELLKTRVVPYSPLCHQDPARAGLVATAQWLFVQVGESVSAWLPSPSKQIINNPCLVSILIIVLVLVGENLM